MNIACTEKLVLKANYFLRVNLEDVIEHRANIFRKCSTRFSASFSASAANSPVIRSDG